eukprot:404159-Pleurochrysis_carterae.AAC.1
MPDISCFSANSSSSLSLGFVCLLGHSNAPSANSGIMPVLFKAFHRLTVKVGVAEHCLREGLDD